MIKQPKIPFAKLKKFSAKKKIDLLKKVQDGHPGASSLLAGLTPTQIAELFPNYLKKYADQVDIRGFRLALTKEGQRQVESGDNPELARQKLEEEKTVYERIKEKAGDTIEKIERRGKELKEDAQELITGGSDVPALSKDAADAWKSVKTSQIGRAHV